MAIQHELCEMIRRADRAAARELLNAWAETHGRERLLSEVLEPTLLMIGEKWRSSESFTLAQAYVAAKVAEDAILSIAESKKVPEVPASPRGTAVIGNILEDYHSLGRRMLGIFLTAEGWIVHDLGNDVPPEEFVDKAVEVGAQVIGVSAMMLSTARNIRLLREEIDRRGLAGKVQLAVGGAVFLVSPGLEDEVGGDGTARTAIDAVALFNRLLVNSLAAESAS